MHFKNIIGAATTALAASLAMAEPAPKPVDLSKLYGQYEKAGYLSLELMETNKGALISGVVLGVGESFDDNCILKAGTQANAKELARLAAADDAQDEKLKALKAGQVQGGLRSGLFFRCAIYVFSRLCFQIAIECAVNPGVPATRRPI